MSKKLKIEAPTPKSVSDLQETGFHLKPISRRSCASCPRSTIKICDALMQADSIYVFAGGTTCDIVRARGPKHS